MMREPALIAQLVAEARTLRDRLIDQIARHFTDGQPHPGTVVIRRRLSHARRRAHLRYLRRLVRAATQSRSPWSESR